MNSLALFCKLNEDCLDSAQQEKTNIVECHINLWKTKHGLIEIKPNIVFDFGIKFDSIINEICIFLPFHISKNNGVKDLGKCLSTNNDLLNAVFNEDMISQSAENHCFCQIMNNNKHENDKDCFYVYYLGEENITFDDYKEGIKSKGTYLTIKINGTPSNEKKSCKYYIRFRVYAENVREIVRTEMLSNDLLQAAFSRMDLFDIRLNEKREIPSKVEEKMKKHNFNLCSFSKLHFFYIVDTRETINNGIDIRKDSRLLEYNQWKVYEPKSNIENVNYVAHHWKRQEEGDKSFSHFSLFFSTIYPKLSFPRLLAYLSVIIILGWIGSMLSFEWNKLYEFDSSLLKLILIILILSYIIIYMISTNFIFKIPRMQRKL